MEKHAEKFKIKSSNTLGNVLITYLLFVLIIIFIAGILQLLLLFIQRNLAVLFENLVITLGLGILVILVIKAKRFLGQSDTIIINQKGINFTRKTEEKYFPWTNILSLTFMVIKERAQMGLYTIMDTSDVIKLKVDLIAKNDSFKLSIPQVDSFTVNEVIPFISKQMKIKPVETKDSKSLINEWKLNGILDENV
ncbi:MAG: hypothetical protein ACFFDI_10975 [Promethearchaeota archaeon]